MLLCFKKTQEAGLVENSILNLFVRRQPRLVSADKQSARKRGVAYVSQVLGWGFWMDSYSDHARRLAGGIHRIVLPSLGPRQRDRGDERETAPCEHE